MAESKFDNDYFHLGLLKKLGGSVDLSLIWDMPTLQAVDLKPTSLKRFSRATSPKSDRTGFVHFFEADYAIARIWRTPDKYIPLLSQYDGVIGPDFSMFWEMPTPVAYYQAYRSRLIAAYLQSKGLPVIPNVRLQDHFSQDYVFDGLPKNSTLALGTHSMIKDSEVRQELKEQVHEIVKQLEPNRLIVFGPAPADIFGDIDVEILKFKPDAYTKHGK